MQRDLGFYLDLWQSIFSRRRTLLWSGNWLRNGYCRDCKYCCGPQDDPEPFPMVLLPGQLRPDLEQDFYLLTEDVAYIADKGCKACGSCGCRLSREKRPVSCSLFPLVLVDGVLYLYKICPAVLFTPLAGWTDIGRAAAAWLQGFRHADLHRISLVLPAQRLAERYICLDITLF